MECRKCYRKIKDGKDVFDGDLCESCFLGELLPENNTDKDDAIALSLLYAVLIILTGAVLYFIVLPIFL